MVLQNIVCCYFGIVFRPLALPLILYNPQYSVCQQGILDDYHHRGYGGALRRVH